VSEHRSRSVFLPRQSFADPCTAYHTPVSNNPQALCRLPLKNRRIAPRVVRTVNMCRLDPCLAASSSTETPASPWAPITHAGTWGALSPTASYAPQAPSGYPSFASYGSRPQRPYLGPNPPTTPYDSSRAQPITSRRSVGMVGKVGTHSRLGMTRTCDNPTRWLASLSNNQPPGDISMPQRMAAIRATLSIWRDAKEFCSQITLQETELPLLRLISCALDEAGPMFRVRFFFSSHFLG
jgi:hypothetical protein